MTNDLRVTADANILASGVVGLRAQPVTPPAQFVQSWQAAEFLLILSEHLLGELDDALAKPYFTRRLRAEDRAHFRQLLRHQAIITPLTVTVTGVATHPEDDLVLATALSGDAQFLVTGDHKLLALKAYQGLIIVSVHAFLAMLPGLESLANDTTP